MNFFDVFSSNTYASSGNQHVFEANPEAVSTGRVFYKIAVPGQFGYSLLFSNILDSTYADGTVSHKNLICDSWQILDAKIARCSGEIICGDFADRATAGKINSSELAFTQLTFGGNASKTVAPGEFFCSDPVLLDFSADDYLCLEMTFSGQILPYHEESLLPIFIKGKEGWTYDRKMPLPGMIGCDRKVAAKVGYIGDSITQGIGTPRNSYLHWNALLSRKIGGQYAYWNLGIGYGRADDMASEGAWAYKAKQNDVVIMCYGVNDILRGFSAEQIKENLRSIVSFLKKAGKKVILQTVPPFNYNEEKIAIWQDVNAYIREVLSQSVDHVFDVAPILAESDNMPQNARYGGHPDSEGCAAWAEAFYGDIKRFEIL